MSSPIERVPPHNLEAEQAVLAAMLVDREAIARVMEVLEATSFYRQAHGTIYEAMTNLYERGEPVDLITLRDALGSQAQLESVGGYGYLVDLASSIPTTAHAEFYAKIVADKALLRALIRTGSDIVAAAFAEDEDLDTILDTAERTILEVGQKRSSGAMTPIKDVIHDAFETIEVRYADKDSLLGATTGFYDLDHMLSGFQPSDLLILAARPAMGKCLTAHTLIVDPDTGERVTIEECVKRQMPNVLGIGESGVVHKTAIGAWIDSGVKPCFRVKTRLGREVEVTGHHPFLTVFGWTPLHDLKVGNKIGVPRLIPVFGDDRFAPELARLLAYFIAEGGLSGTTPGFSNADPEIVADFKATIDAHFPGLSYRQDRVTYYVGRSDWRFRQDQPNPVTHWLRTLGLWGKKAEDKFIPNCVWKWTREGLREFLRALMSCDGTLYAIKNHARIEFTVASERLARDVQHALTRFGIVAKFWQKTERSWRVEITDPDSVSLYQSEIGWIGEKSQRLLDAPTSGHTNVGQAPRETWDLVRENITREGISLIDLARRCGETQGTGKFAGYNAHTNRGITRSRLMRYAAVLGDQRLFRAASPDLYWDEIVSIEPIGEHQVYDLTVPDGANFIAQDVCVHNTSLALNFCRNVAVAAHKPVLIFSLEMSKEQLVQRLLCAEAAIDSHRLRTGYLAEQDWGKLTHAIGVLSETSIYIDDTASISISEARSKARRIMAEHGELGLIMVDYLQLMSSGTSSKGDNRTAEMGAISRGLKQLAREMRVPVIALSQLSRAVESRTDKRPMLSDLRESGCLTGETQIYLPEAGVYRRLDSLIGQTGFKVLAVNTETWKLEPRTVTHSFPTGTKPVFKLTTRLGRTIRATANHKFLTISGWHRLDALEAGMRLALPRTLSSPSLQTMGDAELGLLGHLIGDGCTLPRQSIHYTTNDPALAETVVRLATEAFGPALRPRISPERSWYQVYLSSSESLTHGNRNPIAAWLDELGVFGLRSHEKFVPEAVFRQPEKAVALFLRHLWSTDGCIHLDAEGKRHPSLYYASSSERLARDVNSLLLRLGIVARLARSPQKGKGRDQFHVTVSGHGDILRFLDVVGALGTLKVAHAARIRENLAARRENTNRDVLPRDLWQQEVLPALAASGMTHREAQAAIGNAYCGSTLYRQNMSRERAGRVASVVGSDRLAKLAQSDVYWDEIVSIVPDGEEPVYDLTVEGLHNFVANDMLPHNSIEQDADIVMFIYRDEYYNPDTDKKATAEVIVAKHRNGPVGKVDLYFEKNLTKFQSITTSPFATSG